MARLHRPRFPDPNVPPPGESAVTYGTGLKVTTGPTLEVDFGTEHDQVARGDSTSGPGASLPGTPADVLADAGHMNSLVVLNELGEGDAIAYSASGRTLIEGTPAEGRGALSQRLSYDFSSSSGWTLTPGSGGAAITGGVVRLTMPSATTSGDAGRASVTRDISSLVDPSHFRARLRIVSNTNGESTSFFGMHLSSANLINEIRFTVKTSGALELGFLGTGWSVLASAGGGSIGWDGTWWIEIEVDGLTINCRFGQGTTSDPPADDDPSWRWLYTGNVFSAWAGGRPWNTIGMYLTTFGGAASDITMEADDLILERTALTR